MRFRSRTPLQVTIALVLLGALWAAPRPSIAAREPDLKDLALAWLLGDFRSPLVCEIGPDHRRVLRRVLIRPPSRRAVEAYDRVTFFDLEAPAGTRCVQEQGGDAQNVIGTLALRSDARGEADTALYDFQANLRREGGFDYQITRGELRLGPAGAPLEELVTVDFSGGSARVEEVRVGSDAHRRLADLPGRRKRVLEIAAPDDGPRVRLELVELGRPAR
jgi:hypothetical protein